MDKNKIKKFAVAARKNLRNSVRTKLADYGITDKEISKELPISTIDTKYYSDENYPVIGSQIKWRQKIVNQLIENGYNDDKKQVLDDFIEEVAYTWFNRIIAIRFMEVNNYLPTRVRVLSNEEGKTEPEIIDQALIIEDDLGGYSDKEKQLIDDALNEKTPKLMDDLYAMLFIKQCDALSKILPGLFEQTRDYLKLLFTPHYNRGVIQDLITQIPESYFDVSDEGQVQIIGWLYQYYNAEPHKDVVNMNGKAIKKDKIPAATQLFTPDWIVKYMVDNSLGKYYLERHVDSPIKDQLKYLLPDKLKPVDDLKDIAQYKLLDNAMGSGHILVYAFDLFMQMYIEVGYSKRDAASLIIENNLFGLEIDRRAYQLAYFSLMMKGREYDRRFFRREPKNNLYYFEDLHISDDFYKKISDEKDREDLQNLLKPFSDATELGSIIKLNNEYDIDHLIDIVENLQFNSELDVFGYEAMKSKIMKTLNIVKIMSDKYEAVVTNPPYMNKFDKTLKKYLNSNYKDYSKDLFSVFIYHNMKQLVSGGYAGYMTPLVWMFIKTYEKLRTTIIDNVKIDSLIQMEYSAFEEATVPIDTFVLKNSQDKVGTYLRLSDFKGGMAVQEQKVLDAIQDSSVKYLYHTDQNNFPKIPRSPIAYWVSEQIYKDFSNNLSINDINPPRFGMSTSDNKRFVRAWTEIGFNQFSIPKKNYKLIDHTKKWYPYNNGGKFRRWYGDNNDVVNWKNDGEEIKQFKRSAVRNQDFYLHPGITWTAISSGRIGVRFFDAGFLFSSAGFCIFGDKNRKYLLGLLNSVVGLSFLKILSSTINFNVGDIARIPVVFDNKRQLEIADFVNKCINISRQEWDAFETSWDFQRSPLITENGSTQNLKQAYENWATEAEDRFNQLKSNEEELNKTFIDLYGLQDELTPEEDDKDVSVRKADKVRDIKAFLSYFIGCVFGRYSLDEDGLIYAGGEWNPDKYKKFQPNKDNIVLLTDRQYFDDERDIIVRLKEFLSDIYSPASLSENLDFIAKTLDPKKFEKGTSSEEIIRNYFINDFYKDHEKIYQKRPIYWEFNSGRNKGFKALMYLHRYTPEELAMVRTYLHDLQPAMNNLIEIDKKLVEQETTAHAKSQYRKIITKVQKQLEEMIKYDQILDHLSQNPIELDLDDGVLVNHEKLQQGEKLLTNI